MWQPSLRSFAPGAAALGLLGTLLGGCLSQPSRNDFRILLTPRGDSLHRRITIEGVPGSGDSSKSPRLTTREAERLAAAYGLAPDTSTHRPYVAERRFGSIPNDVGNRGTFLHRTSALGASWTYRESFRGMDDPARHVADRFSRADSISDLTLGWLTSELGTRAEFRRAARDIDREVREVTRQAAAIFLLSSARGDTLRWPWIDVLEETHPLIYLPMLLYVTDPDDVEPVVLARARDDLARRMELLPGVDRRRALDFLSDPRRTVASARRFRATAAAPMPPDSGGLGRLWAWNMASPLDSEEWDYFDVELALPVEPAEKNGVWDDSTHRVRWRAWPQVPDGMERFVPLICEATWSLPDTGVQKRLFGEVVIEKGDLFDYNEWFGSLAREQQAEWNRMLLGLRPGRLGALERFRFAEDRARTPAAGDSVVWSLADYPRDLIQRMLQEREGKPKK